MKTEIRDVVAHVQFMINFAITKYSDEDFIRSFPNCTKFVKT